ncbi:MAG: hypothetical protein RLZ98_3520 [Pseudomonadota bacterium]|jgi:hypothetical protein
MPATILEPVGAKYDRVDASRIFALGEVGHGTDGTEWIYVKASGAITQYAAVGVKDTHTAYPLTSALAVRSDLVGFAQVAIASSYYGWVARRGSNIKVKTKASALAAVQLWTTASAGVLDDATAAGALKIDGMVLVSNAGTAATGAAGIAIRAAWPAIRET